MKVHSKTVYEVYLDGKKVGATPLVLDVMVGRHELELREPGAPRGIKQTLSVQLAAEYNLEVE